MKTKLCLFPPLVILLLLCGCGGGTYGGGNPDYDPPVWDTTIGIGSADPGAGSVTVRWGTATDARHPTVSYRIYMDIDDSPWDSDYYYVNNNDPITFTGLIYGQTYWFGVRTTDGGQFPPRDPDRVMAATLDPFHSTGKNTTKPAKLNKNTGGTLLAGLGPSTVNMDTNTKTIPATPSAPGDLWVRTWGGVDPDESTACMADSSGNIYTAGYFSENSLFNRRSESAFAIESNGAKDSYLSKFDAAGTHIWTRTWGGSWDDVPYDLAVDASDQIYVTGYFESVMDIDPGVGVDQRTPYGETDSYLMKFTPDGYLVWANTWGGIKSDYSNSVCSDINLNVFVAGSFMHSLDFDPGIGEDIHASNGGVDACILKFDADGNYLLHRLWGGNGDEFNPDEASAIECNSEGIYITGKFSSTVDFNPGPDVNEHTSNGFTDAFLLKLDQDGLFLWARSWGGTDVDSANDLAIDESSNIYITGSFSDSVDFAQGSGGGVVYVSNGSTDVFLSRFDSSGSLTWARAWGGSSPDYVNRIETDINGNVFVLGDYYHTVNFDPGSPENIMTSNGDKDIFLGRFSPDGKLLRIHSWGSNLDERGMALYIDGSSNIAISGSYSYRLDFDEGPGISGYFPRTSKADAFLMKLTPDY